MRVPLPLRLLPFPCWPSLFTIFNVFIHAQQGNAANISSSSNRPFLDVYLRVEPVDDFCGALRCNISYALLLTNMQNKFDLHSLMLQDGHMPRRSRDNGQSVGVFFEDNTVVRLSDELRNKREKIYLGLMFFDLPDDIQDYLVVEVTNVIRTGRRVKTEFSSDTVRIGVQVYRRNEAAATDHSSATPNEQQQRHGFSSSSAQLSPAAITAFSNDVDDSANNNNRQKSSDQNTQQQQQQAEQPIERDNDDGQKGDHPTARAIGDGRRPLSADGAGAIVGAADGSDGKVTGKQQQEAKCSTNVAERSCACCDHVTVRKIRLDDEVCMNVTYLPTKIGIRLALSVDGHVYMSKDLAVLSPESVCFEVPELRDYASICIHMYNMELKENKLTGCAKLEAILLHLRVAQHKIGCFSLPI